MQQIKTIFSEHKETITEEWIAAIFGTYDIDTVGFLRSQDNAFSNPVGNKTKKATAIIIGALADDNLDSDILKPALNEIVQVRAVQKFEADQAMAVLFILKTIIRKHIVPKLSKSEEFADLLELESKIDSLALMGFRIYSECRDKVQRMRVDEFKRKHFQLLKRAERILEKPVGEPES
ncbi:RsbRD N-terminal domain-containing protein [Halodesulfovibrio sp.]|jgi:hypothetical protein|uniref:RsbRD N-terminal domain-containing protein n=1 Tax=Halodesulfovibrio sp. TaxID=1912772 RepID=UPI0025D233BF|nr:RsbRD N-terminal domain-containing protein [Halodesulfovibrio sp.]MCT4534048.1 RsbRD N-terminal domain-containing protein [Halodesulfovibrio sp.]MCT4627127.1 RsbRD N-terminal domain-containing protein [Halodesulfovibrio sp.]